jgi:glycosyltransferase involved in cell wall biosynthesis
LERARVVPRSWDRKRVIEWWQYGMAVLAVLGCCVLGSGLLLYLKFMSVVRRLRDIEIVEADHWPRLSLVITACNEADTIGPALNSLLQQDYPNLEFIVVNDRSTDGTKEIVESAAQSDERIRVVNIDKLPADWLGKVHALDQGVRRASGDWILFTDADVCYSPGLLKKCMAVAIDENLDHVSLLPNLMSKSFVTNLMIASSLRGVIFGARAWRYKDPNSEFAIGAGAFNLVRKSLFDKTEGFEWLKFEVADDLALAMMLKKAGGKSEVIGAADDLIVPWYTTLKSAFFGLEKNAFANVARYSLVRGLGFAVLSLVMILSPYLAFAPLPWSWIQPFGFIAFGIYFLGNFIFCRWSKTPLITFCLSQPFGDLLMVVLFVWASFRGFRRGGMIWRGTVYSSAQLREGVRVNLF